MKSFVLMIIVIIFTLPSCSKETLWESGTPMAKEKIKIAVIHPNEIDSNSFYDYAHYEGTVEMQRNIGLADSQIIRKLNVFDGDPEMVEVVMRDCISEGANIILSVSWGYMNVCEKLAEEFPSVVFLHATGYKFNNRNFTNCSIRFYQARYLSGVVAGMQTKTGRIGYVAAWGSDNSEVTAGINAFAIGVREVNPSAQVYVQVTYSWYDPMGETDAANALIANGCDVIAAHSNTPSPQIAAEKAGVWSIGFNSDMSVNAPDTVITSVVPLWGPLYTRFVQSVIDGTFRPVPIFDGLKKGAVDITPLNENLARQGIVEPGIQAAVEAARKRIIDDGFNVFDGVLKTNDGGTVGEAGSTLPDEIILSGINWYYENVIVQ